jgi:signal transduction histidine kinase
VSSTSSHKARPVYRWTAILFVLVAGLAGIHRLGLKASLPFPVLSSEEGIHAGEDFGGVIHRGDLIRAIDDMTIHAEYQLEFLLDGRRIGESITVSLLSGSQSRTAVVGLVPSYPDGLFILINLLIGMAFWGTALFVILKKPEEEAPSVLFWVLNLFALALMTSSGNYSAPPRGVAYLVRTSQELSYMLAIAAFVHFTMVFPERKWKRSGVLILLLYVVSGAIGVGLALTGSLAIAQRQIAFVTTHHSLRTVLDYFLLAGIVGGFLNLFHSYYRLQVESERRRIKWILWGSVVGVAPFLILHKLPQVLGAIELLREEFLLAFLMVIPISFAIAVVKHRIFEIDVIISQSISYTLLTGLVVGVYFGIVALATSVFQGFLGESGRLVSLVAAIIIALLFNPARHRIQGLVDRTFYRVRYDFRETLRSLNAEIKESVTLNHLGQLIIERLDGLIPVVRAALIVLKEPGHRMKIVAHRGFDLAAKHIPSLRVEQITTELRLPVARPEKVEPGIAIDKGLVDVFERWGISLALPLSLTPKDIVGVIVLGDKRSGRRYSYADIDLLMTVAAQVALAVRRLQLQEQVIVEEAERKRLEELNALKSDFVSSVSHELRTPLTSIQLFAETLLSRNVKSHRKRNEYLRIIQGESERLTRLINNILDFAKIERGVKQYTFEPTDIRAVVLDVLKSMGYQFEKMKFRVQILLPKKVPIVRADKDAVSEALINLLSNGMKYSGKNRSLSVHLKRSGNFLSLEVKDRGVGIPEEELQHIFEKFYRVRSDRGSRTTGAGLGLALVKHIMEAHGGTVTVRSTVGKGSTFTLLFPIEGV